MKPMIPLRRFFLVVLSFASLEAKPESAILAKLDQAAPTFAGATANLTWIDHQAVVNVDEKQIGTIAVKRSSSTKAQYVVRFTEPDEYAIALRDDVFERYTPKNNLIRNMMSNHIGISRRR